MDNTARDLDIAKLYAGTTSEAGWSAAKLASKFGLSVPQIRRILAEQETKRNPLAPKPTADQKMVDAIHRTVGNRLYAYRFAKLNDTTQAADALGWSAKKLRSIEQGLSEISLSDLQDMAEYMKISISDLTRNL